MLILLGSRLILPACSLGIGKIAALGFCPAEAAALDASLLARRTELERRIAALQSELSNSECHPQMAARQPEVDRQAWEDEELSLLEGCWELDQIYKLRDINTNEMSEFRDWQVCFDSEGQGTQTLRSTRGVTCESPIAGSFEDGGRLMLRDPGNVPCSDNSFIFRRDITCTLNAERAVQCTDWQPEIRSGSPSFRMRRE